MGKTIKSQTRLKESDASVHSAALTGTSQGPRYRPGVGGGRGGRSLGGVKGGGVGGHPKSLRLRRVPVPASCPGVPGGAGAPALDRGERRKNTHTHHHTHAPNTHHHTHTHTITHTPGTVAQGTCPVLCPRYQTATVSRGGATALDPGQVV